MGILRHYIPVASRIQYLEFFVSVGIGFHWLSRIGPYTALFFSLSWFQVLYCLSPAYCVSPVYYTCLYYITGMMRFQHTVVHTHDKNKRK